MSRPRGAATSPRALTRRFEAVVVVTGGTGGTDARADGGRLGRLIDQARRVGIEVTIAADEPDEARRIVHELWQGGIAASQVLALGRLEGVPAGVVACGGGPDTFAGVLEDQIDRRRRRELPIIDPDPGWSLSIDGVDPVLERVHESLLTLADGRLGTRGSVLVGDASDDPGVLLSGVYAGEGPETKLLRGPEWNRVSITGADELTARRVLDLRTGTLSHELVAGDGRLQAVSLSSLARPATAVLRVRGPGAARGVPRGLTPPDGAGTVETGGAGDGSWMRVTSPPGSIVAASHDHVNGDGRDWALDRIVCFEGAPTGVADERAALARLDDAREQGFERLWGEHRRAWAARWKDADICIDGDRDLQLAVRFALFHLMASVPDEGEAAVGARGLSGGAYRGHVFWDSDVYVLPFLAATHPPAARAMLEYRVRRLPAALDAAVAEGRAGARFAWESAASGVDVTPRFMPDRHGDVVPISTGRLEEHIVADIAWAAAHYIEWTGDEAFAAGSGLELFVQTARWWASRIELDADGSGHIRDVVGPDEYHEHVDDNAYTNVMARWNLRHAADAAPPGDIEDGERRRWRVLAESLVDGYDLATGVYEQFAGFSALEPLVIAAVAPRRPVAADVLLGVQRTRGAQVVKQADVLMLHYLVPDEVVAGSLEANLAYYEPRTAHGSTLSPGVHATLLARAGRSREALELLRLTARIDRDDIGDTTAGGLHLAAMGSTWRALALGFGGLRPVGDALAIDPVAPEGLDAVELTVRFRGSRVRLRIEPRHAEVTADPPLTVLLPGGEAAPAGLTRQRFDLRTATERTT